MFETEVSKEDAMDVDEVDDAIVPVPGFAFAFAYSIIPGFMFMFMFMFIGWAKGTTCAGVLPSRDKKVTVPFSTTKCPCCIDPGGRAVT